MKIAGVTAEYNPFHSGHEYQLKRTRESGATHIVAVMSGNFVQRGDVAIMNKWARAKAALLSGADLIVELPLPWAMSRAQTFAQGSIGIFNGMGCIDMLAFGSECGDANLLTSAVKAADDGEVLEYMRELLDKGSTFAAARSKAVRNFYPDKVASVLENANDTLAVEYLRASMELGMDVEILPVQRVGALHDGGVSGNTASASFIRSSLKAGDDALCFMPQPAKEIFVQERNKGHAPVFIDALELAILAKLRTMTSDELKQVPDVSEGLENRILSSAKTAKTLDELYSLSKTKRYTHARIRRIVLSAYLGIRDNITVGGVPYIRVLGMNERGREILRVCKESATMPIVMRSRDFMSLDSRAKQVFLTECKATDIYSLLYKNRGVSALDMTNETIII